MIFFLYLLEFKLISVLVYMKAKTNIFSVKRILYKKILYILLKIT
jgi:hypothetical protein